MDTLRSYGLLVVSLFGMWFSVAMVEVITGNPQITSAAAILSMLGTLAICLVFALTQITAITEKEPSEKAKRADGSGEAEARLAVLLSLMTPDERATITARLAGEMEGDGEIVSIGDLLAGDVRESGAGQS